MSHFGEFEEIDKQALINALVKMHVCPNCRQDLLPVALFPNVWGCKTCKEAWFVPEMQSQGVNHAMPTLPTLD